ncbi:MAG TPA: RNA polymerase sigma factor [Solirubrobacteraceae bacterium]|jgi:RNA polymerase sigma-70 factor (ECF subfamily)|nr:RNA polymerase sigma factor [Solirubrobacteraceae bacterium]
MAWSDDTTDVALVAATARGNDAAFALMYRRYLPLVVRWCLRETGNAEVAADLAAEVFAASLSASRRYRSDEAPVSAWLLGIARNKLRESRRRGRVEDSARRRLGVEPVAISDLDLGRVEELASLDEGLAALVDGLPEDQRAALLGRVVEERSYEEIAVELRCSESVVRQRVSRALKRLKSQLEER